MTQLIIKGPFKLVSVNPIPERAKKVISRVIEDVKDKYLLVYTGNAEKIEEIKDLLLKNKPQILFCASVWTLEESEKISKIGKETLPDIKILIVPYKLHIEGGQDKVVEYIKKKLPEILDV